MREVKQTLQAFSLALSLAMTAGCGGGGGETASSPAAPASGILDTTYGSAGRVTLPSFWGSIAVDRAGNLYASGTAITKVDPTGRPAVFSAPRSATGVSGVALDDAGNVFGIEYPQGNVVVTKRDASGRLVETFGQGGITDIPFTYGFSAGTVFVDAAGNLYRWSARNADITRPPRAWVMTKRDAAGRPVLSYGGGEEGILDLPNHGTLDGPSVTVDGAGNAFVVVPMGTSYAVEVFKFDADGRRVGSFRNGETPLPCNAPLISAGVAAGPSGSVYIAGSCARGGDPLARAFIVKLDSGGNLDASFGTGGMVTDFYVAAGSSGSPRASRVDALLVSATDAVYVVISASQIVNFPDPPECGVGSALVKVNAAGRLGEEFGDHGLVRLELRPGMAVIAADGDSRLYLAGPAPLACPATFPYEAGPAMVYRFTG
jgi:YD repeat-containing protein